MEQTKLTIRLPRDVLDSARQYAREHNTTVTRLVSAYISRLRASDDPLAGAPAVRRLSGILPPEASVAEYHHYLEGKYGEQG